MPLATTSGNFDVRGWLESQLQRNGDEDSLLQAIESVCRKDRNLAWDILSQLDQLYRRRRIPEALFQAVKRRTEQLAVGAQIAAPAARSAAAGQPRLLRGRYELLDEVGQGVRSTLYRARDRSRADLPDDEQFVAIKLLHANGQASGPELSELLRQCHRAQLLSHPNIVRIFDVDRDRDQVFLVMELLQGMSLQLLLNELPAHRLPLAQALAIIRDVGAAVAYAHSRQVTHGDLQPSNVLIDFDNSPRVINFASTADPADDLNALGCLAYELLAGRHPFGGQTVMEARQLGLRAHRPAGLTRQRWRALQGAMSWERSRRPESVTAWLGQMQLQQAAERLAPLSALLQAPVRPPGRPLRWVLAGMAAVLALVALGAGGPIPGVPVSVARWQASAKTVLATSYQQARLQARGWLKLASPSLAANDTLPIAVAPAAERSDSAMAADEADSQALTVQPTVAVSSPTIQLAAESTEVAAGDAAARIIIRRNGDMRGDVGFMWWTEPGTARPGIDYVSDGPQRAHIATGEDTATLFVPLIKDSELSGDAVFYVQIRSPTGAALGAVTRGAVRIARAK